MKQFSTFLLTLFLLTACQEVHEQEQTGSTVALEYEQVSNADYELIKPKGEAKAILILFGGYPEVAEDIKREFQILEQAKENAIAVIYTNYNRRLWLEQKELYELAQKLKNIFTENNLPTENIVIGGFSSGGNIALLIGNYLSGKLEIGLKPNALFIIDSPIDLAELYFSSEKNLKRNFSSTSVQESSWLIDKLGSQFGNPHHDLSEYEGHSVFTLKTGKIQNIQNLKHTKIRMYTEPDTLWWKKKRMADYHQTNAYLIKELSMALAKAEYSKVEYIPTKNRGFRSNGDRHPHSWSIVKTDDLITWMLAK